MWDLGSRDQPWIDDSRSAIRRDFTVADWVSAAGEASIDRAVLVQVLNDADETADLLAMAAGDPHVAGVVGWIDLAVPDVADRVAALMDGPNGQLLVGIRHQALAEAEPAAWLSHPRVQRGLAALAEAALPFDLMFRPEHVDAVLRTVQAHPGLTFVLDHVGKPPIASRRVEGWAAGIHAMSREPNLTCKLSGMLTLAPPGWSVPDLRPYADEALQAFGADRILFGSDWPVSLTAASYAHGVAVVEELLGCATERERDQIFGATARGVYARSRLWTAT